MLSSCNLLKRFGVSGQLAPFFKCVALYFLLGAAGAGGSPSLPLAAAKCAPVLCLLACVLHQARTAAEHNSGRYARRVAAGLALSSVGDALLVWPHQLVAGMAAFGAAHVAYLLAFSTHESARGRSGRARAVSGALCLCACGYGAWLGAPGALRALVPLYAALLAGMAARATRAPHPAHYGALLFLLSDAILGYTLFRDTLPYKQVLVMATYYLGQMGIALSALDWAKSDTPKQPVSESGLRQSSEGR